MVPPDPPSPSPPDGPLRVSAHPFFNPDQGMAVPANPKAPGGALVQLDAGGRCVDVYAPTGTLFGFPVGKLMGRLVWEQFSPRLNDQLRTACEAVRDTGKSVHLSNQESASGQWFETDIHPTAPGLTLCIRDVSYHKNFATIIASQQQILEMVAQGEKLPVILDTLLHFIEAQSPELLCSILLLQADGKHVRHAAGPSLPEEYCRLIDGLEIGPHHGSCGTALFLRKPVFVADIATDPLWQNYRDLAGKHGLRACWSTPIFDADQKLLGSFAIYHRETGLPTSHHRELINLATHLGSICISQHLAAKTLRLSEERYALAVRGTSDGIWDWNIRTNEDYLSPRWKNMLGFEDVDLPDHADSFYKRLHPDDLPRVDAALQAHFKQHAPFDEEIRLRTKDGRFHWFRTRGQVEFDHNATPVRMAGTITDIHDRKEMELALELERNRATTVLNSLNSHIAVVDRQGDIVAVNESWLKFARENGAATSDRVRPGVNYLSVVQRAVTSGDTMAQVAYDGIAAVLNRSRPNFQLEYACDSATTKYWFLMTVTALQDGNGAVLSHENITARTLAQRAVQDSVEFNRQIIASANEGIVVLDRDLHYTVWNDFMANLLGFSATEVLGRHPVELFPWIEEGGQLDALKRALAGETIILPDSQRLKTRTKRISWLESRLAPLRDRNGEIIGVIATISDVTKRKNAEQELRNSYVQLRALNARLQTVREEQSAHIAREIHDVFGQQLTALKLDLVWLKRRINSMVAAPESEPLLTKLDASVDLVDSSIRSVQKVATELRPGLLDKLGLAAAIEHEVRAFAQRSGLQCHLELSPAPACLHAKQAIEIFRVAQELLTNVARHAQATQITVRLRHRAPRLVLEIEDNGRGIAKKQLAAADSLGLLGMKERAQILGGTLVLRGTPGSGTFAKLTIPLFTTAS